MTHKHDIEAALKRFRSTPMPSARVPGAATFLYLAGLVSLAGLAPALGETLSVIPEDQPKNAAAAPTPAEQGPNTPLSRPADQPGFYGRLGIGVDWPEGSRYRDANCASTATLALYGCGNGNDGRPLGADGHFDATPVLDTGVGYRINSWLRAEALLSWRPDMDFSGQSNFLGAAGSNQPVSGTVSSLAGFGVGYVDLPRMGNVRPFLGAGLGVARNRMGAMNYGFPNLSATATTTTPSGSNTDLAYLLTAGFSVPLGDRFDLDLAYRFTDLGQLQTDAGPATVVRSSGTRSIDIGSTKANLQSHGVMLSLRYRF